MKSSTGRLAALALAVLFIFSAQGSFAASDSIVRVTASWPCKIDPAVGYDNAACVAHANLYDTLILVDIDGSVKPHVAKSWTYSATTKTYTFTLEKGIKFHSGNALTSADVVYSLNRMLAIGQGWSFVFKSFIKDVQAPAPDTVKIVLTSDYGPFLQTLIHMCIVDQKTVVANTKTEGPYGSNGDYGKDWLTTHDAGSGPYMVEEMKTAEYLLGKRFPQYWKGVISESPEAFKMIGTTEAITVRALMSRKDLEIGDEWQTAESYAQLKNIPGVKVADFVVGGLLILHINTSVAPLDDVHVRKALQYCFDYNSAQQLFPGSQSTSGPVGSALPGYNEKLAKFTQNIAKAKEELALSKYKDTIKKYEIELGWVSEVPDEEKIAMLLQSNAQEIGIKIKVTKAPWLTWLDRTTKAASTPGFLIRIQSSVSFPEAGAPLDYYRSTARGGPTNCHWFTDEVQSEMDKLVGDALATMDQAQRYAKYKIVAGKIVDYATDIWAVEMPQRQAYQSSYLRWPAGDAAVAGTKTNVLNGFRTYFRDMRLLPKN
ncbi:MAG: ABC transporter substrate-binding protein [Candidatus Hydrogenedentales bacterium]